MVTSSFDDALLPDGSFDVEAGSAAAGVAFRARWRGGLLELRVLGDGSCVVSQVEGKPVTCPSILTGLFQRGKGSLPAKIPAGDIVGATSSGCELIVWHARMHNPTADKPCRRLARTPVLLLDSPQQADQAVQLLRRSCCWRNRQQAPRLLLIVNPASGPGKAPSIYKKHVLPMLEAAGCHVEMHLTVARAHATELVQQVAPGSVDAIIAIGGDGTMHEVLQGMLGRGDWDAMRHIPFAQIPCGSGNALAASAGLWSVHTAVHAIIKGQQQPLDIASALQHSPPRRCYCFLSLNFGLITNLDIGTEYLRWMGGTRFVVGALQQILLRRKHSVRVAVLELQGASRGGSSINSAPEPAGAASGSPDAAPSTARSPALTGSQEQEQQLEGLRAAAAQQGPPVQQLAAFQQLAAQQLPPAWQWLPEREVQLFTATNLPRLDMNFHLAPEATLDSGCFNLIYTPPASRRQGLELMSSSEKGQHMHLVKQRLVTALALTPESIGTWLVVDGEEVPYSQLFMEVHPSLCSVIVAPGGH